MAKNDCAHPGDGGDVLLGTVTGETLQRALCDCLFLCLPHRDPQQGPAPAEVWQREYGNLLVLVERALDADAGRLMGWPFGPVPRLLMAWMANEVLRTRSDHLSLDRLGEFMVDVGVDPDLRRGRDLREQMERVFGTLLSFCPGAGGWPLLRLQMVTDRRYFLSDDGRLLWRSSIVLGEAFFETVTAEGVASDPRVLKAIRADSLALDLYAVLNREAFRARRNGESGFLSWDRLHRLIGDEFGDRAAFLRQARPRLEAIRAAAGLAVRPQRGQGGRPGGLWVAG